MKYLKLFEYYSNLESELAKYNIKKFTINNNNTIDVNGIVNLSYEKLTEIPFQFGKVEGSFNCSNNQLASLKGCPNYVDGYYDCDHNQLTTLEYAPKYVGSYFSCENNNIRYIQPDLDIEGDFYIHNNPIGIIFNNIITTNKQILEELDIYNPISKDGLTVYKTKLKDMYRELGKLNKFDNDIQELTEYYKII